MASIRLAGQADSAAVSTLCRRVAETYITMDFNDAGREKLLVQILGREAIEAELGDVGMECFVLEFGGSIQGVLARKLNPDTGCKSHIRHFYVDVPGRGFGRMLWATMLPRLIEDRIRVVTVISSLKGFEVYRKFGFRPTTDTEVHKNGLVYRPMKLDLTFQVLALSSCVGSRIALRQYRPQDAQELHRHADNKNVAMHLRNVFPHPYTVQDAEDWISFTQNKAIWAITLHDNVIGNIGLLPLQTRAWGLDLLDDLDDRFTCELGYWLGEEHWGHAYMSEAVSLLLGQLKGAKSRIVVRTALDNTASRRIVEKAGFRQYRQMLQAEEAHAVCEQTRKIDCDDWLLDLE